MSWISTQQHICFTFGNISKLVSLKSFMMLIFKDLIMLTGDKLKGKGMPLCDKHCNLIK